MQQYCYPIQRTQSNVYLRLKPQGLCRPTHGSYIVHIFISILATTKLKLLGNTDFQYEGVIVTIATQLIFKDTLSPLQQKNSIQMGPAGIYRLSKAQTSPAQTFSESVTLHAYIGIHIHIPLAYDYPMVKNKALYQRHMLLVYACPS